MLYLIIPPIIVVLAIISLVYFFSRKFPQIEEVARMKEKSSETASERKGARLKHLLLHVLEGIAQGFRLLVLKTHNVLHKLVQYLREKKKSIPTQPSVSSMTSSARSERHQTFLKARDRALPTKNPFEEPFVSEKGDVAEYPEPAFERKARPMVSEKVTLPKKEMQETKGAELAKEKNIEPKNQFEDILIERIAMNPRDLEAYERLGEYYMEQGNLQDAKECYRQVLRLSPVHRLAKIKIRRLEKKLEQKQK